MAARPPLSTRWGLLMLEDTVAQRGSLLAWFAITQGIMQHIPPPSCWPYVLAVFSLQLGLLAFLDYRDWVRHEVQEEASRLDPSLSVSPMLLLSSPELQDQYYRWMDKTPAVTWYPLFLPLLFICASLKLLSKNEDGCDGFALIVPLPSMVLALVRVVMENFGAPKESQSIVSLVALAYNLAAGTGLIMLNDTCMLSIGPDWSSSPAGNAVFVGLGTAGLFAIIPCTMQHIAALCVMLGPFHTLTCYIRSQRRHGGLGLVSYPTHYLELVIIIAGAKTAALLVGAAVRYRLAKGNMTAFLRSIRPHRH